ncbi:hypothetical protein NPA08_04545 [Mycoplasmopsis citelli]|uniref:Uncharacterized protein n=1 Tax=Mycoplasmopsis citelli TaxID=171281 RepID=A0A449B2B1_9BACT|nr:hypothetical protein [Mycoplasmopsis citelli]UUD36190.1 hypothetical protein NPA08_04545 [Mycoplasmopsis citelli]VEU74685.1 Uncharacterised protein [Mycoplasmopsis citelli]
MNNLNTVAVKPKTLSITISQIFVFLFLSLCLISFVISSAIKPKISYMFLMVVPFSWLICLSAFGTTIAYKRKKDSNNTIFWLFISLFSLLNIFLTSLAIGLISVDKSVAGHVLFSCMNLLIIVLNISSLFVKK